MGSTSQYASDRGLFGHGNDATKWAGVTLCKNVAALCDAPDPLRTLGASLLTWADLLMGSDGADASERKAVESLRTLVYGSESPEHSPESSDEWFVDSGHTMFRLSNKRLQITVQPLFGNIGITRIADGEAASSNGCPEGFARIDPDVARETLRTLVEAIRSALAGGDLSLEFSEWPKASRDGAEDTYGEEHDEADEEGSEDDGDDEASYADISPHFESDGWLLPIGGDVAWSDVVEHAGVPREASLLSVEEWRQAAAECRVVSVLHDGDGSACIGRVGHTVVGRPGNYCRVVFAKPIAPSITIIDVDVSEIDCDFEGASEEADDQGKRLLDACLAGDLATAQDAIRNGASLEYEDYGEGSNLKPLSAAIQSGATDIVRLLLSSGVKPDSAHAAWVMAASIGKDDIAEVLAKAGFEVSQGAAILHACKLGRCDVIQRLAKSVDLDESYSGGDPWLDGTALVIAARHGQGEAVKTLLSLGASTGEKDSNGIAPWVAAMAAGNEDIAAVLTNAGAPQDLNHALMTACSWGNLSAIRKLLAQGADPKARCGGRRGETTPLFTCMNNSTWLDDDGKELGFEEADQLRSDAVEALCSSGADPSELSGNGERPLHAAVRMICRGAIPVLIRHGAEVDAKDSNGDTPLIAAIESGKTNEMWRLLQAGADPNCNDKKGNPAMFAMFREYGAYSAAVVKTLLAFGVDLDAKSAKGASLRKRCQKAVDNPDAEGGTAENAQELLDFLEDSESRKRFENLMRRPVASSEELVTLCDFVAELMDDASQLPQTIDEFVASNGDLAADAFQAIGQSENWRVREQAVRAIERQLGARLPLASVVDVLMSCSFDDDSDVRAAADRLFIDHADKAVPLVLQQFLQDPIGHAAAGNLLGLFEAQRPSIIKAIGDALSSNPDVLTGRERIAEGRRLATKAALEAEQDPEQAIKDGSLAVKLEPSLQNSPWAMLAGLQAERGNNALQLAMESYNEAQEADSWSDQRQLYDSAIAADPAFVWPYNNIAWRLATAADPDERDGAEAVRFASKACELDGYRNWSFLDTLAAAHAENGDYDKAVECVGRAIAGCPEDVSGLESLMERYQARQAYPYPDPDPQDDESADAEDAWNDDDDE
jgi:ankyrin repeat protein